MVDQSYIDGKVTEYVLNVGKFPKFVLLDADTFDRFSDSLKPRERIVIAVNDEAKIARMGCSAGCWVDILSVGNKENFFEVTG